MLLQNKALSIERLKGKPLLESLEAGISKQLGFKEAKLRYFITSVGAKRITVEVSSLKE